jgi:hypothetical protein
MDEGRVRVHRLLEISPFTRTLARRERVPDDFRGDSGPDRTIGYNRYG